MKRTPLWDLHRARGACFMDYQGWEIPAEYCSLGQEYRWLSEGAGLIDFSYRGKIRIAGEDRKSWLHRLVTQEIAGLPEGQGAEAAILNPQGHLVTNMRVFALPGALLCDFPAATGPEMAEHLDAFLFTEQVEIQDLTDRLALLSVQGPCSALAVRRAFGEEWAELPRWGTRLLPWKGVELVIARVTHCGEDGFDFFVPAEQAVRLLTKLAAHRHEFATDTVGWNAVNLRRLEGGIPWWGQDLDPSVVPFAARLDRAVSLDKGCYTGQEIIARLVARGQVNNLLCGFNLEGDRVPARGEEVWVEQKAGRITSAARSLRLDRVLALGYLRREHAAPGTRVTVRHAGGEQPAVVTELPFVPNDY